MLRTRKQQFRVTFLGAIVLALGCQTRSGTPVDSGILNKPNISGPELRSDLRENEVPLRDFQIIGNGLNDCAIPFDQLRRLSPSCANSADRDGRRCEMYQPYQFPEVVEVRRRRHRTDELVCTGTVIAASWVVTAAHCLAANGITSRPASFLISGQAGASHDDMFISASFADLLGPRHSGVAGDQKRSVVRQHVMPSYSGAPQYADDIALLELDLPFPAEAMQPAILARAIDILSEATLAGYGVSDANGGSVGFLNVNWPARVFNDNQRINFVPSDGTAFCKGDSGGPMFAGRYRGCMTSDTGGEPRPRILQGVISNFSYRGIITPALSNMDEANICIRADKMAAQSVAAVNVRRWICSTTNNAAQGC